MSLNLDAVFDRFPVLETERLILRQFVPEDAPMVLERFSDPEAMRYSDMEILTTLAQASRLIEGDTRGFANRQRIRWAITLKEDGVAIGSCCYHVFRHFNDSTDIGYDMLRACWNRGIMTEALGAMIRFGFETIGLNRIEAMTMLWNVASMRVLDKQGFREEGILREYGRWKGVNHDLRLYALLRRDYAARTGSESR